MSLETRKKTVGHQDGIPLSIRRALTIPVLALGMSLGLFFCNIVRALRTSVFLVPRLGIQSRRACALPAGLQASDMAKLLPRVDRKLRLRLVCRPRIRAYLQFLRNTMGCEKSRS